MNPPVGPTIPIWSQEDRCDNAKCYSKMLQCVAFGPGGMRRQRVKTLASIGNAMAMWVVSPSTAAGSGMK